MHRRPMPMHQRIHRRILPKRLEDFFFFHLQDFLLFSNTKYFWLKVKNGHFSDFLIFWLFFQLIVLTPHVLIMDSAWMEVAFAKRAGKALIAAFLMKRPGNACLIVQAKESLIWNPKLVNVIKDSSAMIALPGFAVWIVDPMEGEFFQNYFLQSCKNETF